MRVVESGLATALEAGAARDPVARALVPVLLEPATRTNAGHPSLSPRAWETLRDRVPHLLGMGPRVLVAASRLLEASKCAGGDSARQAALGCSVAGIRQVVLTAAITAPCDLWLLRHVLGFFAELGLLERLLRGEAIDSEACEARVRGERRRLHAQELDKDLQFLLARGLVEQYDGAYRIAGHPRVRCLFSQLGPVPSHWPSSATSFFSAAWSGGELSTASVDVLLEHVQSTPRRREPTQTHWIPDREEVELGHRLLPIVLSLRAVERTSALQEGVWIEPQALCARYPAIGAGALEVLAEAGWMRREAGIYRVTSVGARGFAKGPGPFGIVEAYHPYMARGREILLEGRCNVWVARGENVGASQDANRVSFERANDALDAFCSDTRFSYRVFIEHAMGRGEATRQRFSRSGSRLVYVGADLEDAAIDAALEEQRRGRLPAHMRFLRNVDIGQPSVLIAALRTAKLEPRGAVMLVGNGFHEIREQTDEKMIEVFRGYHDAGIVLLFTEESALSVEDLRGTAWNTYHAGFRYVHDKSGQGLRPAEPSGRPTRVGRPLPAAWSECAERAGYVRVSRYCRSSRAIYPATLASGHNPSISVTHFVLPGPLARELGLLF